MRGHIASRRFLVMLAAVVAISAVLLLRSSEPVHEGRPLSAWVQDLSSQDEETHALALESIQQIGPKAVPFLLKPFRLFSPSWKMRALKWLARYTPLKID